MAALDPEPPRTAEEINMTYWHPQRFDKRRLYTEPPMATDLWLALPWGTFKPFLVPRYVEQEGEVPPREVVWTGTLQHHLIWENGIASV
jgi:hypothetical protein